MSVFEVAKDQYFVFKNSEKCLIYMTIALGK